MKFIYEIYFVLQNKMANESGRLRQCDTDITYDETKRFIRSSYRTKYKGKQKITNSPKFPVKSTIRNLHTLHRA